MTTPDFAISQAIGYTYKSRLIVHGFTGKPIRKIVVELDKQRFDQVQINLPRRDLVVASDDPAFQPGWRLTLENIEPGAIRERLPLRVHVDFSDGASDVFERPLSVVDDASTVKLIACRYPIVNGYEPVVANDVVERLKTAAPHIKHRRIGVEAADFEAYFNGVDYRATYPRYAEEFAGAVVEQKAMEHFLGFQLIPPKPGRIYIDAAASNSPCAEIMRTRYGVEDAYAQDLNFEKGVHGRRIGSNGNAIPLKSGSVTGIYAHNSWEHFEGWSDVEFLLEASRLLSVGGRLAILPLEFATRTTVLTSPSIWSRKYVNARETPNFDPRAQIVLDDKIQQRQIKLNSIEDFVRDLGAVPLMEWTVVRIQALSPNLPAPRLALVGVKQKAGDA